MHQRMYCRIRRVSIFKYILVYFFTNRSAIYKPVDCDMACHKKCEKLTGNLCGLNQKLVAEALQALKKGE